MHTQESDQFHLEPTRVDGDGLKTRQDAPSWKLLVVEYPPNDLRHLATALRRRGHTVRQVNSGMAAMADHHTSDLLILDFDLLDLDGLEVCRAIRAVSDIPIIAVAARDSELDRVLGLQAGADDYMTKPCQLYELIARMDAIMRRVHPMKKQVDILARGPLEIDAAARRVQLHGKPVELTRKEFDLLRMIAQSPGKVHSRKELMHHIWGGSWSRRTIDTHVSSIRKKLGDSRWITAIRGVGFQFSEPDQDG